MSRKSTTRPFTSTIKGIHSDQTGKRPPRIERPGPERNFDHTRLVVDGAFTDAERGTQVRCRHVRGNRFVAEKVDLSKNVDDTARPAVRLTRSERARALPA